MWTSMVLAVVLLLDAGSEEAAELLGVSDEASELDAVSYEAGELVGVGTDDIVEIPDEAPELLPGWAVVLVLVLILVLALLTCVNLNGMHARRRCLQPLLSRCMPASRMHGGCERMA